MCSSDLTAQPLEPRVEGAVARLDALQGVGPREGAGLDGGRGLVEEGPAGFGAHDGARGSTRRRPGVNGLATRD